MVGSLLSPRLPCIHWRRFTLTGKRHQLRSSQRQSMNKARNIILWRVRANYAGRKMRKNRREGQWGEEVKAIGWGREYVRDSGQFRWLLQRRSSRPQLEPDLRNGWSSSPSFLFPRILCIHDSSWIGYQNTQCLLINYRQVYSRVTDCVLYLILPHVWIDLIISYNHPSKRIILTRVYG